MTKLAEIHVPITSDADIVVARQQGRLQAQQAGFNGTDLTVISTAISEIARNIVEYACPGEITILTANQEARVGIVIIATDEGPGIADLDLAMLDGYSSGKGLGLGLPGARRLMDEFQIDSVAGKGTRIIMKKWRR